ncbi:MAG TPA: L-threonylcarbamoyladenylate synthase [Blastocatellia bacterium]|jgi:L-threonylcarbamoyladenylate synthase|nr:L-threonylcarbamoyladenylate synthase [Blastocatellia bacterium]
MDETITLKVDPDEPDPELIERAAQVIRDGGLVAFPTETVYGLGADAMNERAVRRIFEAKGRPADNPLIVHVADREMLSTVAAQISSRAERLIQHFWPGPLTLVLKRGPEVALSVSAGLETVAVRMPRSKVALQLLESAGRPIAAPSANASGRLSPTSAQHVLEDLGGKIDIVLDAGPANIGIESTVLDLTSDPPVILRPGWITKEALSEIAGPVDRTRSEDRLRSSPGTRHRHYSPLARLVLAEGATGSDLQRICQELLTQGPVGFVGHTDIVIDDPGFRKVILENSPEQYARSIYGAMRFLDECEPVAIVVEGIADRGQGEAVMDRLRRAASWREPGQHR